MQSWEPGGFTSFNMQTLYHTLRSALAILLAVFITPGVWVIHVEEAAAAALIFGFAFAVLPSFLSYAEITESRFATSIFALVGSMSLVLWVSVVSPGFFVAGALPALAFMGTLTFVHTYAYLYPDRVARAEARLRAWAVPPVVVAVYLSLAVSRASTRASRAAHRLIRSINIPAALSGGAGVGTVADIEVVGAQVAAGQSL